MSLRSLNVVLGGIMFGAIVFSIAASRDFSKPNLEVLPDMVHGPTYRAFEANENNPDGKTLRDPAPGSIPRGYLPFPFEATEQDAKRAGEELINPNAPDDVASLARGAVAYGVYCQQCHGPAGEGDGMVAKRGFPPPPSLLLEHAIQMKDGQMFHVITLGQANMPGHAAQVPREDRWNIIMYIRSLQAEAQRKTTGAQP